MWNVDECALQTTLHFLRHPIHRGMLLYTFGFLLVIQVNIKSTMTIIRMLLDHRIISVCHTQKHACITCRKCAEWICHRLTVYTHTAHVHIVTLSSQSFQGVRGRNGLLFFNGHFDNKHLGTLITSIT